jgi:hypothetical protein
MIYVDDRAGSAQLGPLLRARGVPVTMTRMAYGDVSFIGQGAGGVPVSIGIEVKSLRDVLACICNGRFAGHQLPGLVQAYEKVHLLVEGTWRPNARTGILQLRLRKGVWVDASVGSRRFMFTDLLTWLFTMENKAGILVSRVSDWQEATLWLSNLYAWWTAKGWDGHKSHLAFHDGTRHGSPWQRGKRLSPRSPGVGVNVGNGNGNGSGSFDRALLARPTLCRMVSAQLPGVGFDKSMAIVSRFRTVEQLVAATQEELAELPGIGKVLARKIHESLRGSK